MTAQNYYTITDTPDYEFCKTPKAIFTSKKLKKLSDGAKLLYIAILTRLSLSIKNGLKDENNRVIVYYSIEDVCEDLGCSHTKAVKLFAELDIKKGAGLIDRKRLGLCKTSIIFVLKPEFETNEKKHKTRPSEHKNDNCQSLAENSENPHCEDVFFDSESNNGIPEDLKADFPNSRNCTSEIAETENQECNKSECNYNKINNNKINNNYLNNTKINLSSNKANNQNTENKNLSYGWKDRADEYKKIISQNISYETLIYSMPQEWLDEIIRLMTDVLCTEVPVTINNINYPHEAVKERFLNLHSDHIEYVWECMRKNKTEVKNIKAYMISVLYRAPETMMNWYCIEASRDGLI